MPNQRNFRPADGYEKKKATDVAVVVQQHLVASEPEFRKLATSAKRNIDYAREVNFALSLFNESQQLQKCDPESFREAFENLGAMGLSLNRNLGQAALIPRWNAKRKKNWAVVMPMYRGYIALATGGPVIKNVWGNVVIDGDVIEISTGSQPDLVHKPKIRKRGEDGLPTFDNILGAYCIAEIAGSSSKHITWVGIDDILAIAERSDSFNPKERDEWKDGEKTGKRYTPKPSGPWVTDPGQMAVKSAFRRAFKTWPGIDRPEYVALQEAVRVDTQAEIIDHDAPEAAQDEPAATQTPEATLLLSPKEVATLRDLAKTAKLREVRLCEAYGLKSLDDLPAELFIEVKGRIDKFASKNKGASK